jgi:hypothetical protein
VLLDARTPCTRLVSLPHSHTAVMEKQAIDIVVPSDDPKKKKPEEQEAVDGKDEAKKQDKDAKDGEELVSAFW